jgi:hypothetical protein
MAKTDSDGIALLHLDASGDTTYKFIIEQDNLVVFQSTDTKTYCDTTFSEYCTLDFYIEEGVTDPFSYFEDISSFTYQFDYDNATRLFTYAWTDTSGAAQYARLFVVKIGVKSDTTICNKVLESTSGTLACNISAYSVGDFRAEAYISRSPELFVDSIIASLVQYYEIYGNEGVFWAALIILCIFMIGIVFNNPIVSIILASFGLFVSNLLGLIGIGTTAVIAIMVLAAIIIMKMKRL